MSKTKRQRMRNPLHFYVAFAVTIAVLSAFSPRTTQQVQSTEDTQRVSRSPIDSVDYIALSTPEVATLPKAHAVRSSFSGDWTEAFPDSQATQLSAAVQNGIVPSESREQIETLVRNRQLVNILHSPLYHVDDLSHSVPYLVPKAQQLLNTISANFLDSLSRHGLKLHVPIVTSVLRTTDDVSRLQRGNKNATSNSCHCYGTTIDITYHRFQPLFDAPITRYNERLKYELANVLYDLRNEGRCYVKYEYKQACFHLTVR